MENVKELLEKLNPEQLKPVLDTEGAVLVIAGAGSGKTRVLTSRIAYLIQEKNVSPSEILAITFTNKAANEMKTRLIDIVGDVGDMWACTIHSMCVKILRRDIDKIGYDRNFTIYDETDKDKALKRTFEELGLDADKLLKVVKGHISAAKNECLSPKEYKEAYSDIRFIDEICSAYEKYEDLLARSNSLDFDDLLYKTYILFKEKEEVADYYSKKFIYIHIDEFQDTNSVQFAIARRLSLYHGNLFAVGDDDQSIYGWRGAKIENILNFDDVYRGAKIYKLEQNYRSTKKILSLANKIIANNTGRRPKELWTDNDDGVKIETFVGTDENNEAGFTAMQIKGLIARDTRLKFSDFAVFMRVNALSRAYEQEFTKYGIPYKIFGGFRFFERKEIKDVLAYLKVVNNPYDDESFLRSIASPRRGIGEKTLSELKEFCAANGLSLFHGIDRINETSIGNAAKTKLYNFKCLIKSFIDYSKENGVSKLMQYILETTDFLEQFADKTEENGNKLMNIDELKNSAEQYEVANGESSNLSEYLNSVTLSSDTDDINADNAVTVATIHAAKGLEYKCVFVGGLDEDILPLARSIDNDDELEEERRLMYVAVTRARERLYLTRANSRYMYGQRKFMVQSRFLKEGRDILAPDTFKKENDYIFSYKKQDFYGKDEVFEERSVSRGYSSTYAKTMLKDNKPKEQKGVDYAGFKSGVKVKHAKFGEGTVIAVKGSGENVIVDVAFNKIGIKSLSAKFAPMELL